MSLLTIEAEYIAAVACCTQILWMNQTLQDIHMTCDEPIPILCDNTSAISISKNPVMPSKNKHIPTKFQFLRRKSQIRISSWNILGQKNRLHTPLLNLSQERLLSTFEKNWEPYYLLIELIHLQQHINMIEGEIILIGVPFSIDSKGGEKVNKEDKGRLCEGEI